MRILVCEYITGGGRLGQPLPGELLHEGELMVTALAEDLAAIEGNEVCVCRDPRLPPLESPVETVWMGAGEDPWLTWAAVMDTVDAVWPVAPESDGILEYMSWLVTSRHCILLGSSAEAVGVAGSKRRTAQILGAAQIPVVPTFPLARPLPQLPGQWVVKPDDGCGAEGLVLFDSVEDLLARHADERNPSRVAQPYVPGQPISLSLLCANGHADLLACNLQRVHHIHDGLRFAGIVVNGYPGERTPLAAIGDAVAAALPGLWGYIGVDLIAGQGGPAVLEVNPRLTTSYAGLRASIGCNPAGLILGLLDGSTQRPDMTALSVDISMEPMHAS